MHSFSASRLVADEPAAVAAAIAELVEVTWGRRTRLVVLGDWHRVDAIAAQDGNDEADVWMTWAWASDGRETEVRVTLDELDAGPDPSAELEQLLDMLAQRVAR